LQGYLFRVPLDFVDLFSELAEVPRFATSDDPPPTKKPHPSERALPDSGERPAFAPKKEDVRSRTAEPWSRDPSEVDRALSAHARIERLVAEAAAQSGWGARGYGPGDPVFDLLLEPEDPTTSHVVVEVSRRRRPTKKSSSGLPWDKCSVTGRCLVPRVVG
jgi:hypothetical protein